MIWANYTSYQKIFFSVGGASCLTSLVLGILSFSGLDSLKGIALGGSIALVIAPLGVILTMFLCKSKKEQKEQKHRIEGFVFLDGQHEIKPLSLLTLDDTVDIQVNVGPRDHFSLINISLREASAALIKAMQAQKKDVYCRIRIDQGDYDLVWSIKNSLPEIISKNSKNNATRMSFGFALPGRQGLYAVPYQKPADQHSD